MARRARRSFLAIGWVMLLLSATMMTGLGQAQTSPKAAATPPPLLLRPYKPSGIYARGDTVGWRVSVRPGTQAATDYTFTVKKNDLAVIKTGNLDMSCGTASIEVALTEHAM